MVCDEVLSVGDLLVALADSGISVEVTPAGQLLVAPRSRLTDAMRAAIRAHRDALLAARCEVCGSPTGGYGTCVRHDPFAADGEAFHTARPSREERKEPAHA